MDLLQQNSNKIATKFNKKFTPLCNKVCNKSHKHAKQKTIKNRSTLAVKRFFVVTHRRFELRTP